MTAARRSAKDVLGDAERVVRRARGRLSIARGLDWAVRGALAGSAAGLAVAGVVHLAGGAGSPLLLVLPAAGALTGFVASFRGRPGVASAALALDQAAGSDEAFVSALSAGDAAPEIRALSAEYALGRCAERDVPRILRIPTPAAAAAAALATAALCAVVLVPAAERPAPDAGDAPPASSVGVSAGGGAQAGGGGPVVSPEARAARLAEAAKRGDADAVAAHAPEVRGDLAAVSDDDLRTVADALAAGGSADARAALDLLAKGDRAGAVDALRRALGFRDAGPGADIAGGSGAGAAGQVPGGTADPRLPASWPLRYDREVRQWLGMRVGVRNEDRREERK